jgi:hypothetical protein
MKSFKQMRAETKGMTFRERQEWRKRENAAARAEARNEIDAIKAQPPGKLERLGEAMIDAGGGRKRGTTWFVGGVWGEGE